MSSRHPIPKRQPFDVSLETSGDKRLAKLMKALIVTGSTMTCSFRLYEDAWEPRASVHFRVHVPIGREDEFESLCGEKLEKCGKVQVGMDSFGHDYEGPRA